MVNSVYQLGKQMITAKFTILLVSLLCLVILSSHVFLHEGLQWALGMITNVIVISVAYMIRKKIMLLYIFGVLAVVNVCVHTLDLIIPTATMDLVSNVTFLVFCVGAVCVFYHDILHSERVTKDTMSGSICIYLLIGLAYGTAYIVINSIVPNAFHYSVDPSANYVYTDFDFYYYSFVTLTTLGYGDILPAVPVAKAIVILESITGIFYLAILVARLVASRTL